MARGSALCVLFEVSQGQMLGSTVQSGAQQSAVAVSYGGVNRTITWQHGAQTAHRQ